MSTEQNKRVIHRWFGEAMREGRPDLVDELYAERFLIHREGGAVEKQTRADKKAYIEKMRRDLVDIEINYEDPAPFAEGDMVAVHWVARAKNAESGNRFCVVHNYLYRLEAAQIVEEWWCWMVTDEST